MEFTLAVYLQRSNNCVIILFLFKIKKNENRDVFFSRRLVFQTSWLCDFENFTDLFRTRNRKRDYLKKRKWSRRAGSDTFFIKTIKIYYNLCYPLESDASLFSDASCSDINSEDVFSDGQFSEGSDDEGYRTNPLSLPSKEQDFLEEENIEKRAPIPQPREESTGKCSTF